MNPCRCGLGGPGKGACGKAPRCQASYQGRVSGPLLDRMDLQVEVPPVTAADLALPAPAEGTREAAARVAAARAVQEARAADLRLDPTPRRSTPARKGAALERIATPDEGGRALLTRAAEAHGLTARGWTRTLRLARTVADLEGSDAVRRVHVAEALIHRRPPPAAAGAAGADSGARGWAGFRTGAASGRF